MLTTSTKFFREVRTELSKVTWATRKEVISASIFVGVMSLVSAMFFLLIDTLVSFIVRMLLGVI